MIECAKYFDSNNTMSFKVSDKKLLKYYIKIWGKISSLIGKAFDSEPVYDDSDKYIKTKIKSQGEKQIHIFKVENYQKKIHHKAICH